MKVEDALTYMFPTLTNPEDWEVLYPASSSGNPPPILQWKTDAFPEPSNQDIQDTLADPAFQTWYAERDTEVKRLRIRLKALLDNPEGNELAIMAIAGLDGLRKAVNARLPTTVTDITLSELRQRAKDSLDDLL